MIKMMDFTERCQRRRWYEQDQAVGFPTNEMPRDTILRNLSRDERNGLVYLFGTSGVLSRVQKAEPGYGIFAVGTITYPHSYWHRLKEYLEQDDPSKLHYINRRGQDIDLIIASDVFEGIKKWKRTDLIGLIKELLNKVVRKKEFIYSFSEEERENGTQYFTVPAMHIQQEGQRVLRTKPIAYSSPSFRIKIRGCRWFHVSFSDQCVEDKLREERVENNYFALLERRFTLVDAIDQVNLTPGFFDENTLPKNDWLNAAAEKIITANRKYRNWVAENRRGVSIPDSSPESGNLEGDEIPF